MRNPALVLALCAGLPILAQAPGLTVSSASGDSNVTLYGILDAGLGRIAHSATYAGDYSSTSDPRPSKIATKPVTGMLNGGLSGNRLGLRGGTKVNDDLRAIFNLEAAINITSGQVSNGLQSVAQNITGSPVGDVNHPATGQYGSDSSLSGQLFGRQANFGIESKAWGSVVAGRNSSLMSDFIPGYDPLGGAQMFSPVGYSSTFGAGGMTDNARLDNSLKYRGKFFGAFTVAALHKFGGVSGDSGARAVDQGLVAYEQGAFGVSLSYIRCKDATSAANYMTLTQTQSGGGTGTFTNVLTNPGQVKVTFYDTKATLLMAKYRIGKLWIKAGAQRQEITDPSDPGSDMSLTSLYGQLVGQVVTNALYVNGAEVTKKLDLVWIGASYDVTDAFNVAVGYYGLHQNDFSNGGSTAANKAGYGKFGSLLLDYRISKALDVYAGYMNTQYSAGMAAGYPLASNNITGIGARYAF
jgi:predicted porin